MEKMEVLILTKKNTIMYEHVTPCHFAFCNRLADCKFQQATEGYMCKDHLHSCFSNCCINHYGYGIYDDFIEDKENIYLLIKPTFGKALDFANSVTLLNQLEKKLGWKESNWALANKKTSLLVYLNSNWVCVPYLFHFVMYLLRGGVYYNVSLDPIQYIKTGNHADLYSLRSKIDQKLTPLLESGYIFDDRWEKNNYSSSGWYGYTFKVDETRRKQIKKYDKEKEKYSFKDWYSLELQTTS